MIVSKRSGAGAGGARGECVITHLSDMAVLSVITVVAISYLCVIISQHFASVLVEKLVISRLMSLALSQFEDKVPGFPFAFVESEGMKTKHFKIKWGLSMKTNYLKIIWEFQNTTVQKKYVVHW